MRKWTVRSVAGTPIIWFSEQPLFNRALVLSFLLHISFWAGISLKNFFASQIAAPSIEIDLTKPFIIGGNPLKKPGGGPKYVPEEKIGVPPPPGPATAEDSKPKEWILPGPETKVIEKPQEDSGARPDGIEGGIPGATGSGYPGDGPGWTGGAGEGGGIPIDRVPQLLNRPQILRMLRRLYPLAEREAEREGVVIVNLHLDSSGNVSSVDVVGSAGENFDSVAQIVAKKMRFSPAVVQKKSVAVKLRQSIEFKLEELEQ